MEKINDITLTYCDLGIAYQCNFQCKMCKFWSNSPLNADNILSIEQWKNVLQQISEFADMRKCPINFSGPGEPLLRDNIFDLIKYGISLGLQVQIISNGFCVNKQIAADIADSGLKFICFSLDSLNPEVHDFLRGRDNSCARVFQAIDNISAVCPDICIGINTVISGFNIDSIIELTQWVQNDPRIAYINFQAIAQPFSFINPPDEEWFERDQYRFLWPWDKQKTEQTINNLIELKTKGYKIAVDILQLKAFRRYFLNPLTFIKKNRCNLGQAKVLNIDAAGNVSKCQLVGIIDNVKNGKSIKQIYSSLKANEHKDLINNCQRNCHLVVSCYYEEEVI